MRLWPRLLKELAQNGHVEATRIPDFVSRHERAFALLKKHAQDGCGSKRPAETASVFPSSQAARIRTLCASINHVQP
jgi:hypothetical protein